MGYSGLIFPRRVLVSAKKSTNSASEKADFRDRQNTLAHRIVSWRKVQALYMPCVERLLQPDQRDSAEILSSMDSISPGADPQLDQLFLPSGIPYGMRVTEGVRGLVAKEIRLRVAQAEDALYQIRRSLRIRKGLVHYKHIHVDGPSQSRNTRARGLLDRFQDKLDRHVARYQAAHGALCSLDPGGAWESRLKQLAKKDVRGPGRDNEASPVDEYGHRKSRQQLQREVASEGRYEPSWIWLALKADSRELPHPDDPKLQAEVNDSGWFSVFIPLL